MVEDLPPCRLLRPIPSGRIPLATARRLGWGLLGAGVLLAVAAAPVLLIVAAACVYWAAQCAPSFYRQALAADTERRLFEAPERERLLQLAGDVQAMTSQLREGVVVKNPSP